MVLEHALGDPAHFNYWDSEDLPTTSGLYDITNGSSPQLRSVQTQVQDIRSIGISQFGLDTHGFQVLQHASSLLPPLATSVADFSDQELMKATYWPELIALLKDHLGIRAAAPINTTVREMAPKSTKPPDPDNPRADPKATMEPFFSVRGDYTAAGARSHLRAMLPSFFEDNGCVVSTTTEERATFLHLRDEILQAENEAMAAESIQDQWIWSRKNYIGPRWAILSVWRPLEIVHCDPLAVMDPRTLFDGTRDKPYAPLARMYKHRPGFEAAYMSENMLPLAPKPGRQHRWWYYISEQRPEEVYALKLFDNEGYREGSNVAPCAAHSAFALEGQETKPLRKSAEVRMMVIW